MNTQMTDIEWGLLRSPLLILLFVICAMGGLVGGAWYYQKQMQVKQTEADEALKKITEEHKKSQDALAVYHSFADKFKQLQEYYFLQAEERRNQWVERLHALRRWRDFLRITTLQSEPPQEYLLSGVTMEKDFHIKLWKLRLQINLLHTGNLVDFIDHLYASHADGLYNIQECELSLKHDFDFKWQDNINDAGLEGYCILRWYVGEIQLEKNDI